MFYQTERTKNEVSKSSFNCSCWLKFELIEFCKANELSTQGSKIQLRQRIKNFLDKKVKYNAKSSSLKNKRRTIKKIS
ncbi:SAP domain-containing protein [Winogradskyella eximia]|jgi:SAP domain-containing new25|uniref:SAP domain-containing protein n=1 Tax=Winogradskyella eximia TaxID=262006 RepID=UPI003CD0DC69